MTDVKLQLYGLLHIKEGEASMINASARTFDDQIRLYLKDASTLACSLKRQGIEFTLVTNSVDMVQKMFGAAGHRSPFAVQEISCNTDVPSGIRFYSAHFKLDVFKWFATLPCDRYYGLIDLDVIAISNIPQSLLDIANSRTPLCYDITDQVIPAYGADVVKADLERLTASAPDARWYGGELIMGTAEFFARLSGAISRIYPRYRCDYRLFRHQGDEVLTSAAIECLRNEGVDIKDAGKLDIICRYWSVCTLHAQRPLDTLQGCFLLHLPADKVFLAKMQEKICKDEFSFIDEYRSYQARRRLFSLGKRFAKSAINWCRRSH